MQGTLDVGHDLRCVAIDLHGRQADHLSGLQSQVAQSAPFGAGKDALRVEGKEHDRGSFQD